MHILSLHRCRTCGTRWLLWPDAIHGGGWNLLDKYSKPGACCDNVAMGDQIEHLRDIPLATDQILIIANVMNKLLPAPLLAELLTYLDPLGTFTKELSR